MSSPTTTRNSSPSSTSSSPLFPTCSLLTHEQAIMPSLKSVVTGAFRTQIRLGAITEDAIPAARVNIIKEANRRAHNLRIHDWTPRPSPLGKMGDGSCGGSSTADEAEYYYGGSVAVQKLCSEFAVLAVELEEGWALL